jgi:hypothetical protein
MLSRGQQSGCAYGDASDVNQASGSPLADAAQSIAFDFHPNSLDGKLSAEH